MRIAHSYHGAELQKNTLANSLEVSAGVGEAFLPNSFSKGAFRRADPRAGASHEGFKQADELPRHLELPWEEPLFSAEASRRAVLAGFLGTAMVAGAQPALAGYVTSLGLEVTKPEDAEVDEELLGTRAVRTSLSNLKAYMTKAASLKGAFAKDQDMQLIPTIRKEFDFSKVRDDLNVVTTVFDDDTQKTIDRITRAILYDLTELENSSRFKKGETTRTPKKIALVNQWFDKLDGDFLGLFAYFAKVKDWSPPPAPTAPPEDDKGNGDNSNVRNDNDSDNKSM